MFASTLLISGMDAHVFQHPDHRCPIVPAPRLAGRADHRRRPHPRLDPLLAGGLGALLTLWVTFAPCFFWIFLGAPYVEVLRGNRALSASLTAITAAVVGVVMNLALWFALHVVFREVRSVEFLGLAPDLPVLSSLDWRAALLSAAAMIAMLRFKIGMIPTLAAAGVAGTIVTRLTSP